MVRGHVKTFSRATESFRGPAPLDLCVCIQLFSIRVLFCEKGYVVENKRDMTIHRNKVKEFGARRATVYEDPRVAVPQRSGDMQYVCICFIVESL